MSRLILQSSPDPTVGRCICGAEGHLVIVKEETIFAQEKGAESQTWNDVKGREALHCRYEWRSAIYKCEVCGRMAQLLPSVKYAVYWYASEEVNHDPNS